jgi:hypothetical protein
MPFDGPGCRAPRRVWLVQAIRLLKATDFLNTKTLSEIIEMSRANLGRPKMAKAENLHSASNPTIDADDDGICPTTGS